MKSPRQLSDPKKGHLRKDRSELRSIIADNFRDEVCKVYDLLVEAGMEPKEAIRKTRSALKAINYPFATYDVVMAKLRASGRLRKHLHTKVGDEIIE
jgi:protein required for attachment to host cells